MATFVSNKIRAFQTPGNTCDLPTNSESIFHLKSYDSATDPRAWALESNDRKSYILDLFTADNPKPQVSSYCAGVYKLVMILND